MTPELYIYSTFKVITCPFQICQILELRIVRIPYYNKKAVYDLSLFYN